MKCDHCGKEITEGQTISVTVKVAGQEVKFCDMNCWGKAMSKAVRKAIRKYSSLVKKAIKKNKGGK